MYETLLTNEECANAVDLGNFYRVPSDKRDLIMINTLIRAILKEIRLPSSTPQYQAFKCEETREKIASLAYIREELSVRIKKIIYNTIKQYR